MIYFRSKKHLPQNSVHLLVQDYTCMWGGLCLKRMKIKLYQKLQALRVSGLLVILKVCVTFLRDTTEDPKNRLPQWFCCRTRSKMGMVQRCYMGGI